MRGPTLLRLLSASILMTACSGSLPAETRHALWIVKQGNGNGTTSPATDWFPGMRYEHAAGEVVKIVATPDQNSLFLGWSGDLGGEVEKNENMVSLTMDRDRVVKAEFGRDLVGLTFESTLPEGSILSPKPIRHLFHRGDLVVLGAVPPPPGGKVHWNGPVGKCGDTIALVEVAKETRVSVGPDSGKENTAAPWQDFIDVAAADGRALHVPLMDEHITGWFTAPLLEGSTYGAGISWLAHARHPNTCPFLFIALNYEHVLNGAAADRERFSDTPRRDPMRILPRPPATVEARWSADSSAWPLDCAAVYTLSGENAVDLVFDVTPRKNCFPKGYLVLMFASYLNFARDGVIHFPGIDKGGEGWTTLGAPGPDGKPECGNVPMAGAPLLGFDPEVLELNMRDHPDKRFTRPFYYGLTDGDADYATTDDDMVVIMMFEPADQVRFALWNWTGNPRNPAWDWHFVPRNPEAGKTERFRARMVFKPFAGRDDVEAEYARWRGSLAAGL